MAFLVLRHPERRIFPRTSGVHDTRVRFRGLRPVSAELTGLSRSGAFLRLSPENIQTGERLELVMVEPERSHVVRMHRRTAIVVRCAPAGVGIAFLQPASPWGRGAKL